MCAVSRSPLPMATIPRLKYARGFGFHRSDSSKCRTAAAVSPRSRSDPPNLLCARWESGKRERTCAKSVSVSRQRRDCRKERKEKTRMTRGRMTYAHVLVLSEVEGRLFGARAELARVCVVQACSFVKPHPTRASSPTIGRYM